MNDSLNRKVGAILQFVQLFLSIIISVVFTSYMIKKLGQEEYSIYSVCTSTIGYLSLLSMGLNSSYTRYYTRAKKKLDAISTEDLNWNYLVIFVIFGFVSFIAGMILSFNSSILFNENYTESSINTASIILKILALNMAISFPATVFSSYIVSRQKFVFLKSINIIRTVFSPFTQFVLLLMGYGSIGITASITAVNLLTDVICFIFCIKKLDMRFRISRLNISFLKTIASFSIFIGINQLVNQINFSADKLILSKFACVTQVAVYSVSATLSSHFEQIGSSIANLFDPKINKIIVSGHDKYAVQNELDEIFIKVGRIQFYILALIITGFIFWGKYFISWWAGIEYDSSYYVALLLVVPLCIPLLQNTAVYIQRAKYKHKFRSILYLCTSLLNIPISIIFTQSWGAIGAALGTTLTLLINSLVVNVYYKIRIGLDIKRFWVNIILASKGIIIPIIWGITSSFFFPCIDVIGFFTNVLIYIVIYILSIFHISFNEYEKELLEKSINKVFRRR